MFADEPVAEGDMVLEYRGVLIRHSVANEREKAYEAIRVGSDYMFRLDEHFVVDATSQGSLARFVNHSCDPNCYTKIISHEGRRKIALYAKRPIFAGEELCYDYKFAIEHDPQAKIACHCGAANCRKFMN